MVGSVRLGGGQLGVEGVGAFAGAFDEPESCPFGEVGEQVVQGDVQLFGEFVAVPVVAGFAEQDSGGTSRRRAHALSVLDAILRPITSTNSPDPNVRPSGQEVGHVGSRGSPGQSGRWRQRVVPAARGLAQARAHRPGQVHVLELDGSSGAEQPRLRASLAHPDPKIKLGTGERNCRLGGVGNAESGDRGTCAQAAGSMVTLKPSASS